ncbi:MAG: 1-acyl-sn-glycerol-3-phosphate acyltransferase, partial [Elusimicrobia bacterium]|nr:1-acyl-sn-glycerol-3-phosphate acyltransferase [Elusimicrobiota bacterium]
PTGNFSSDLAVATLEENKNIVLFPEGGISRNGKLKEFRRGAAVMALRTGRPIVPSVIIGAFAAWPLGAKYPRLTPLKLKIGKPIYLLKEFDDSLDDVYLQEGMTQVYKAMKEMLAAESKQ